MSSIRAFRCRECRAELVAGRSPGGFPAAGDRPPPILCCGRPIEALRTDQVATVMPARRRVAWCPRCGYTIDLVIHPMAPLVCMLCQMEYAVRDGGSEARDRAEPAAASEVGHGPDPSR